MSDCILMFEGVVETLYLREIKTPAHPGTTGTRPMLNLVT